jgi:hypothetical protein
MTDAFPTANDRQEAARDVYRESVAAGTPLSGAELGRRFDRTDRWGRYQITQVRAETPNGNGSAPPLQDIEPVPQPAPVPSPSSQAEQSQSWLDTLITLAVALVAAAASYGHMLEVATLAGEPLWLARAFPITVDGLVLAALRRGDEGRRWLALGALISIAANVLAQFPDQAVAAGPIVSAWPPLALYGTHRLLHDVRTPGTDEHTERSSDCGESR